MLHDVIDGQPVYLTKNGYGAFVLPTMHDEKENQEAMAALQLMSELNASVYFGEAEGWMDDADLDMHFREKEESDTAHYKMRKSL